jgi:CPA2 family monovalent cation:H+ antiporter-2/glutathione-regulated potassium-efflux system ancillary protein KefC
MFLAPLLFIAHEKIVAGRHEEGDGRQESDPIDRRGHQVILAGFGRLGTDLGRFLISSGINPVILDHDAANVDVLRKFGFEVYYGDITRLDLLEAAGADEAQLLIITIGDIDKSRALVKLAAKHYPHLKIAVNAADRSSAYKLMDLGVTHIRRETFGSALELGQEALKILGFDAYEAHRLMRIFRKHDEEMIPELYKMHREDEASYISMYQKHNADLEELMSLDLDQDMDELDKAWTAANPET